MGWFHNNNQTKKRSVMLLWCKCLRVRSACTAVHTNSKPKEEEVVVVEEERNKKKVLYPSSSLKIYITINFLMQLLMLNSYSAICESVKMGSRENRFNQKLVHCASISSTSSFSSVKCYRVNYARARNTLLIHTSNGVS